jgi:hypothetical protein
MPQSNDLQSSLLMRKTFSNIWTPQKHLIQNLSRDLTRATVHEVALQVRCAYCSIIVTWRPVANSSKPTDFEHSQTIREDKPTFFAYHFCRQYES